MRNMANFDTIKLIEEVKRRNVLWLSKNRSSHGEADARIKAWEEIAAILYHDWNICSEVQRVQRRKLLLSLSNIAFRRPRHGRVRFYVRIFI